MGKYIVVVLTVLSLAAAVPTAQADLIVGTGDFTGASADNDISDIDPPTATPTSLLTTFDVWGMTAFSPTSIYFTSTTGATGTDPTGTGGSALYSYDVKPVAAAAPVLLGQVTLGGEEMRVDGLGFDGTTLYGWRQFDTGDDATGAVGLYTIDLTTLVATLAIDVTTTALPTADISGIDIDPTTGIMYGVNDGAGTVVIIDDATDTITTLTAYPVGEFDIDGIAADGAGFLYLVQDEADDVDVLSISALTYTTLASPITVADTFSGAAFLRPPVVPEPSSIGLAALALLGAFGARRRRRRRAGGDEDEEQLQD